MSSSDSHPNWCALHHDIVAEIFKRLDLLSYVRSLSVCVSWGSVPVKTMNGCRPASSPPWLLVSTPNDSPDDSRCFYAFDDNNKMAKCININLPQIAGLICIGSSQGFLVAINSAGKVTAVNPLTGACFPLPPTTAHPDIDLIHHYVRSPSLIVTDGHNNRGTMFRQWAVISSSMDTIAVFTQGTFEFANVRGTSFFISNLAYARVGDDSWTYLRSPVRQWIATIAFHRGCLNVLHTNFSLVVFDMENPTAPPLVSNNPCPKPVPGPLLLTETPDGEDLLVLWRREGNSFPAYKVKLIEKVIEMAVFKLDKNGLKWNELQSIGDIALFLGGNYLSSLSTRELPCFKSNHVYFTTRYIPDPDQNAEDMGVYDLKGGGMQPFTSPDDLGQLQWPGLGQLHWPPPIWFTPRF